MRNWWRDARRWYGWPEWCAFVVLTPYVLAGTLVLWLYHGLTGQGWRTLPDEDEVA